jgi:triacylglycerol lipase
MDEARARAMAVVDPELIGALAAIPDFDGLTRENLADFRVLMAGSDVPLGLSDGIETRAVAFGEDVQVLGLLYVPEAPRGAILNIHGGGYVMGTASREDAAMRALAAATGAVILSVDYRLAPDFPYPAALGDCREGLKYLHEAAAGLGYDRRAIAVRGVSAGGGLAAALALLVRDAGDYPIAHLSLLYPMLDDRTEAQEHAGQFVWTARANRFGWQSYLGKLVSVPQLAAPARALDVAGLPPTLIAVGAIDLFAAENIAFAARLVEAGVPTELHLYPGAYHGFNLVAGSAAATSVFRDMAAAIGRAFSPICERKTA